MREKWDRKERLTLVGTILTFISILTASSLIYSQMRQSNRLAWKTLLQTQANEFSKMETTYPAVACVYQHHEKAISDQCIAILRDHGQRRQALMFVSQVLSFFSEIDEFGKEHDEEWAQGFDSWKDEIGHLDITSYFLFLSKIDQKRASEEFALKISDAEIKTGYLRFKRRVGISGDAV